MESLRGSKVTPLGAASRASSLEGRSPRLDPPGERLEAPPQLRMEFLAGFGDGTTAMSRRDGFTLLELCLAIFIGLMLISLAVPSISGMRAEQKLTESFQTFDKVVRAAQLHSVQERRPYLMVWEEGAVVLRPLQLRADEEPAEIERYELSEKRELVIERPAALKKDPPGEWPFWESGTCEPVRITYHGPEGRWVAEYDALTTQARLVEEVPR